METKDTPQGIVGARFAQALLDRDFASAHTMLSPQLKLEYSVERLGQTFEQMIRRAEQPTPAFPEIDVLDNTFLGEPSFDSQGWAYVAIWSEAVTITVKPFGPEHLITELIWGRP